MFTCSLQSGSSGNAIYVEAGDARLLFDAGIAGKQAELRLKAIGRDIRDVTALLISHDHSDHIRCAGVFQRKFGIPLYATRKTLNQANGLLGPLKDVRHFQAGQTLAFNGVRVQTLPTPHDAADGVAFVVEHAGRKLGVLTDLGHPFAALVEVLAELDACYLESNYDPHMLATGPYPLYLQERIRGPRGHLSNDESAIMVRSTGKKLQWLAAAHLSEHNNCPEVALATHRRVIGKTLPLMAMPRYEAGPVLRVD